LLAVSKQKSVPNAISCGLGREKQRAVRVGSKKAIAKPVICCKSSSPYQLIGLCNKQQQPFSTNERTNDLPISAVTIKRKSNPHKQCN